MTSRTASLLFSSALVSITFCALPAQAQVRSSAPDTGYGTFVPVATTTLKSYADGQFQREAPAAPAPAPQPEVAMVAPAPAAVATQVTPQPQMAPIVEEPIKPAAAPQPEQPPVQTAAVATPEPAKPETTVAAPATTPAPVDPASAAAAPATVPSRKEDEIVAATTPTDAPTPMLDDSYPEEREARTRMAVNDGTLAEGSGSEMSMAASALADLPPVPEDVISNEPISDIAITEVAVSGLERIEPATVESYLDVKVGEKLTPAKRNQSLKALYASGLFSDVAIDQKGSILTVEVTENPQINQLAFEGNKRIEDEDLQKEITLKPRSIYTRAKALADTDRILGLYRRSGRYAARVEPKIIERDQNRVDLAFEINEGPVTEIRAIRFVGNEHFSDKELRGTMASKETRWYRFISNSDQYDPDRFNYDQELLRQFYLRHGYVDFRIVSALAELSPDQENFYLTFTLDEGERYKIGKVSVENNLKKFDASKLEKDVSVEGGDWYNADKINEIVDAMTTTLGNDQYAFAQVKPDVKRNPDTKTVDITFKINESPRVYIERIDIHGNSRTLDKVIRREIDLAEGDPFNKSKLAKSERQIQNLNYFKKVDMQVKEGSSSDQLIVDTTVEEQSTGDIRVGAGFSTIDGPLVDFQIRERNLLGKGQDLRFGTTLAGRRTQFDIGFTEPYFLDRKLVAGIDAFHVTRDLQDSSSYDQKRTGGAFRLGYDLSEKWHQSLKLGAESNEISNVDSDASRFIRDQEGSRSTISINHRLTYDTRDSTVKPTDGFLGWVETEMAGLAGDAKYISNRVGGTYYIPVTENWTLSQMGEVGNIFGYGGEDVEINERFFIGSQTMHGFAYGGLGPRDISTDDALGGNNFYRGSTELDFPISVDKDLPLTGHAFVDYGSVWGIDEPSSPDLVDDASLRVAAGLGVSWDSPFGPLRLDVSQPVVKQDYDEKETIRFSFGTNF